MLSSECSLHFLGEADGRWRLRYVLRTLENPERVIGEPGSGKEQTESLELSVKLSMHNQGKSVPMVAGHEQKRDTKAGSAVTLGGLRAWRASALWCWAFECTTQAPGQLTVEVGKILVTTAVDGKTKRQKAIVHRVDRFYLSGEAPLPETQIGVCDPPRISLALTQAPVLPATLPADATVLQQLEAFLKHIDERLHEGLDELWAFTSRQRAEDESSLTNEAVAPADAPTSETPESNDGADEDSELQEAAEVRQAAIRAEQKRQDERWARAISEVLMLSPYAAPGQLYLSPQADDRQLLEWFQDDRNPSYALLMACQQLCSMALISRGIRFNFLRKEGGKWVGQHSGINAGASTAGTVQSLGGRWYVDPSKPVFIAGTGVKLPLDPGSPAPRGLTTDVLKDVPPSAQLKNPFVLTELRAEGILGGASFGPGSLFVFAIGENKGDTGGVAHVGFVLRTEDLHPEIKRFQFFDTGGMNASGRDLGAWLIRPLKDKARAVETADDPWISGWSSGHDHWGGKAKFCGSGILPDLDLRSQVSALERTQRARPLGLVRVLVTDRSWKSTKKSFDVNDFIQHRLIFSSPLLPMWDSEEQANFSLSRFAWALRGLPAAQQLEAIVLVYVPKKTLTHVLAQLDRRVSHDGLWDALRSRLEADGRAYFDRLSAALRKLSGPRAEQQIRKYTLRADEYAAKVKGLSPVALLERCPLISEKGNLSEQSLLLHILEMHSTVSGNVEVTFRFRAGDNNNPPSKLATLPGSLLPPDRPTFRDGLGESVLDRLPRYFGGRAAAPGRAP